VGYRKTVKMGFLVSLYDLSGTAGLIDVNIQNKLTLHYSLTMLYCTIMPFFKQLYLSKFKKNVDLTFCKLGRYKKIKL